MLVPLRGCAHRPIDPAAGVEPEAEGAGSATARARSSMDLTNSLEKRPGPIAGFANMQRDE
eukprot:210816-Prymnesium_polylepis.3